MRGERINDVEQHPPGKSLTQGLRFGFTNRTRAQPLGFRLVDEVAAVPG